ncbi:hypothetical protein [Salinicola halophyticus]|uniref:hypothetical protein n=1 Tax=Salinicola halophyticus TaxID=1808881 RepID=UPI00130089AB|nr:hypothetical protein [Salinicola halophyticus]
MNRWHSVALVFALSCSAIPGCATTAPTPTSPECTVPPMPVLPVIQSSQLQCLADDDYWLLQDRERQLTDWAFVMRGMLVSLCHR